MRRILVCIAVLLASSIGAGGEQGTTKTLVAVFAHPDDEGAAGPVLARYAREGAQVHLIIVTDGAAGGVQSMVATGPELARVRAEEARCAAAALGAAPPILLGFPDGKLGGYGEDPVRLFRLTQRLHEELQRLRPNAVITWGPDGGTGHPDHRLVSALVTQLMRAGAPGMPDRLFYASLPAEVMRALAPARPQPPLLIPQQKHLTTRIAFTPADLEAAQRSLSCHKSQFPPDAMARLAEAAKPMWNGVVSLSPAFGGSPRNDLFR
jgi:LmbE family N-acetylglucosaminyl deacetylase